MPSRKYQFYTILCKEYPEFSVDGLPKKIVQFPNFLGVFPRQLLFHSQSFPNFRSIILNGKKPKISPTVGSLVERKMVKEGERSMS